MRRVLPLLAMLLLAACSSGPKLRLADHVDLQRYSGRWYIIAEIPYFAEKGEVGSTFDYSFPPPDKLIDVYTGYDGSFSGKRTQYTLTGYIVPDTGNARWRESPFWPLYLSYLILYVSPDYHDALIGYPGRGYGWVISRDKAMNDATYRALLGRFAAEGYDISKFRRVPQVPEQIGKAGF